jgi:hypothetical protein
MWRAGDQNLWSRGDDTATHRTRAGSGIALSSLSRCSAWPAMRRVFNYVRLATGGTPSLDRSTAFGRPPWYILPQYQVMIAGGFPMSSSGCIAAGGLTQAVSRSKRTSAGNHGRVRQCGYVVKDETPQRGAVPAEEVGSKAMGLRLRDVQMGHRRRRLSQNIGEPQLEFALEALLGNAEQAPLREKVLYALPCSVAVLLSPLVVGGLQDHQCVRLCPRLYP